MDSDFGLCGSCWRDTPFIAGLCCDTCGAPLPGEDRGGDVYCDDCLKITRPWQKGRAAVLYRDNGRRLILNLKHGDRHDLIRPAAQWMARAAQPLLQKDMLIAPVPLHWTRLIRRRFNQAALLARAVGKEVDLPCCPDLLKRIVRTPTLDRMDRDARHRILQQVIAPHPRRLQQFQGRSILLIDDVMTTGATLSAATEACFQANAREVYILTLARAVRDA